MKMSEKRLYDVIDKEEPRGQSVSYQGIPCTARHCCTNLNRLTEENEQLRNELQFYDKIINFFASNPMTKYSSKADLIEEMTLLEKMGLL